MCVWERGVRACASERERARDGERAREEERGREGSFVSINGV